jgi:hypothetical protein
MTLAFKADCSFWRWIQISKIFTVQCGEVIIEANGGIVPVHRKSANFSSLTPGTSLLKPSVLD